MSVCCCYKVLSKQHLFLQSWSFGDVFSFPVNMHDLTTAPAEQLDRDVLSTFPRMILTVAQPWLLSENKHKHSDHQSRPLGKLLKSQLLNYV